MLTEIKARNDNVSPQSRIRQSSHVLSILYFIWRFLANNILFVLLFKFFEDSFFCSHSFRFFYYNSTAMIASRIVEILFEKMARLDRSCISSDYFCYFLRCLCLSFVRIWIIANIWENVHSKYQLINIWMKHWKWQIKRKIAFKLNILICLWCF